MYYLPKTAFSRLEILFKMSTLLFADFELLEANDLLSEGREVATLILNSSTFFYYFLQIV